MIPIQRFKQAMTIDAQVQCLQACVGFQVGIIDARPSCSSSINGEKYLPCSMLNLGFNLFFFPCRPFSCMLFPLLFTDLCQHVLWDLPFTAKLIDFPSVPGVEVQSLSQVINSHYEVSLQAFHQMLCPYVKYRHGGLSWSWACGAWKSIWTEMCDLGRRDSRD